MSTRVRILLTRLTARAGTVLLIPLMIIAGMPELAHPLANSSNDDAPKIRDDQLESYAPICAQGLGVERPVSGDCCGCSGQEVRQP